MAVDNVARALASKALNGEQGEKGEKGDKGDTGADGYSPSAKRGTRRGQSYYHYY